MKEELELKEMKEKLRILNLAIENCVKKKERLIAWRSEQEEKIKDFDLKIGELRRKMGILSLSGENVEVVAEEIRDLIRNKEILEQEISSLPELLADIDRELEGLKQERTKTINEIFKLHARSIIEACNRIGEQLASEYRKLWTLVRAMGVPQDGERPASNNAAVCSSFWGGSLSVIPKLSSPEDFSREDHDIFRYDPRDYYSEKARDHFLK